MDENLKVKSMAEVILKWFENLCKRTIKKKKEIQKNQHSIVLYQEENTNIVVSVFFHKEPRTIEAISHWLTDKYREPQTNIHARPPYPHPTPLLHVADTQQGHQARAEGAAVAVEARLPLPSACAVGAGQAWYCDADLPHRHFCERLFLARASRRDEAGPVSAINREFPVLQNSAD